MLCKRQAVTARRLTCVVSAQFFDSRPDVVDGKHTTIHSSVAFREIARLHGGGALNVRRGPASEHRLVIRVQSGRLVVLSLLQLLLELLVVRRLGIVCLPRCCGVGLRVTVILLP